MLCLPLKIIFKCLYYIINKIGKSSNINNKNFITSCYEIIGNCCEVTFKNLAIGLR